jgi:AcrR family transcriptional regulator
MTKAGLLHYFASKEDLLIAVLDRRDELDALAVAPDRTPATGAFLCAHHAVRRPAPAPSCGMPRGGSQVVTWRS